MRIFLLVFLLISALHSMAQPAVQGVRYIVIRKPTPARRAPAPAVVRKDTVAAPVPVSQEPVSPQAAVETTPVPESATIPDLPPPPHGDSQSDIRDLFRVCTGERIVLAQAQNQPLAHLGTVLFTGILGGHIVGLHPDDFGKGYGAAHLRRDITALAAAAGENGVGQADAWCNVAVDVTGAMVFDPQTSQQRFEPRYLHLLWHHPDLAWGECVLTVIPWEAARPWLATLPPQSPLEQQSLAEVIETHQFEAISLKITNNWMRLIGEGSLWKE